MKTRVILSILSLISTYLIHVLYWLKYKTGPEITKTFGRSPGKASHYANQSINQSTYLLQYVGWGCPDHPSQRLMYKTNDNKNT